MVREFLFLKSADKYYACKYYLGSTGTISKVELQLPPTSGFGSLASVELFYPFYFDDSAANKIYVLMNSATESVTFYYIWPAVLVPSISPTKYGPLPSKTTSFIGSDSDGYIPGGTNMLSVQGDWALETTKFAIAAGSTVKPMVISTGLLTTTVLAAGGLSGFVYLAGHYGQSYETVTLPTATSRAYDSETDTISNVVVYGESFFYWVNLDTDSNKRTAKLTTNDIDTTGVIAVSLSSNKAVLLFSDHLSYYKISGSGLQSAASGTTTAISFLFTKTFSTSIAADGNYKFSLSCLCAGMKRFACFSSTLNCLIVKNAGTACGTRSMPEVVG